MRYVELGLILFSGYCYGRGLYNHIRYKAGDIATEWYFASVGAAMFARLLIKYGT